MVVNSGRVKEEEEKKEEKRPRDAPRPISEG